GGSGCSVMVKALLPQRYRNAAAPWQCLGGGGIRAKVHVGRPVAHWKTTTLSIKAAIYHLTHYTYDRPVVLAPQIIRLKPAPHSKTKVLSHSLKVLPANHFVNLQQDP